MISPALAKASLVEVDVAGGAVRRVIELQYNPDTLSRTMALQAAAGGGKQSESLRLTSPAVETIRLEVEIDATDRLEFPAENPDARTLGIHPQLAALEVLLHPKAATLQANEAMASAGRLEVLPMEVPLTVFVWGRQRVVPVRLTELSITEEAFDTALNPIRAKVTLAMRVLSVADLGFDHRGGTLFMGHLRAKEALAARAGSAGVSAPGLT